MTRARDRLRGSTCYVAGISEDAALIRSLLVEIGVHVAEDDVDAAAVVAGPAGIDDLAEWNQRILARGQAFLPVFGFNGSYAQCGPFVVPGESACFECFLTRAQANVGYERSVYLGLRELGAMPGYSPLQHSIAATAAQMIHKWLSVEDPELPGLLVREQFHPWNRREHWVLRVPRCAACLPAASRGTSVGVR